MTGQRISAIDITPGEHSHWHVFGLTLNADTITSTIIAGIIVIGLGLMVRRKASVRNPTKLQLAFETITEQIELQVKDSIGLKIAPLVIPYAMAIFLFIAVANLIALIPSRINHHHVEALPPPAADVNFTYALALVVIVSIHVVGVRKKGFRGYYGHLFRKPYALVPLNLVEEIMKPVTLALRLFGNIFAGTIMVSLIAAMPVYILWAPNILWKSFDAFIGLIQAFIFALLTILYFGSVAPDEEGAHH